MSSRASHRRKAADYLSVLRRRAQEQAGQAVLGVVVLIVLIATVGLMSITWSATPNPGASEGSAEAVAQIAQREADTIAAGQHGSYARIGLLRLHKDNPAIAIRPSRAGAWLSSVSSTEQSFTLTATLAPSGETYTISRRPDGTISRSCTPGPGTAAGDSCS